MDRADIQSVAAALERRRPDLKGRLVADIPEMASFRVHFRRGFYRWANCNFGAAIFNIWVATAPTVWLWQLNALAAGLSVFMMLYSERQARAISRQLNRLATEQIARDLAGLRD